MIELMILWLATSITVFLIIFTGYSIYYGTPNYFYQNSKMNKFGCWLLTILFFAICPWYYIAVFVYWICHIGRD